MSASPRPGRLDDSETRFAPIDPESTVPAAAKGPSFHGWSSDRFPKELKLLVLEQYWKLVSPNPNCYLFESDHIKLVDGHLISLVQTFGDSAKGAYYKTLVFCLKPLRYHFRYPVFAHRVRELFMLVDVDVSGHHTVSDRDQLCPERWLLHPQLHLRWILHYRKMLNYSNIEPQALILFGQLGMRLPDSETDTRWQTKFTNLSKFSLGFSFVKTKCKRPDCLSQGNDCTLDCLGESTFRSLERLLKDCTVGIKCKNLVVSAIFPSCRISQERHRELVEKSEPPQAEPRPESFCKYEDRIALLVYGLLGKGQPRFVQYNGIGWILDRERRSIVVRN